VSHPELRTARLVLRPIDDADLEPLAAIFADPAVTRFIGDGRPRDRERVRRSIEHGRRSWQCHGHGPFVVRRIDDGAVIGDCLVIPIARSGTDAADLETRGPDVEIGYRLARSAWGAGLATEAAGAVLAWAMEPRPAGAGLARLIAVTDPDNRASQRVLEKIGLRRVGPTDAYYDTTTVLFETGPPPARR